MSALATVEQFTVRLPAGYDLDDAALARAEALLDDASYLIVAETGRDWLIDDVADPRVVPVVVAVAWRAFRDTGGYQSETVGSWTGVRAGNADTLSSHVYLTPSERQTLIKLAGLNSITALEVTRPEFVGDAESTYWIKVEGGEDLPWTYEIADPQP